MFADNSNSSPGILRFDMEKFAREKLPANSEERERVIASAFKEHRQTLEDFGDHSAYLRFYESNSRFENDAKIMMVGLAPNQFNIATIQYLGDEFEVESLKEPIFEIPNPIQAHFFHIEPETNEYELFMRVLDQPQEHPRPFYLTVNESNADPAKQVHLHYQEEIQKDKEGEEDKEEENEDNAPLLIDQLDQKNGQLHEEDFKKFSL
jgi:hypothetical protein